MTSTKQINKRALKTSIDSSLNSSEENQRHKSFVELIHHCSLCGSPLELEHTVEEPGSMIREEAKCVNCDIRTRNKIYNLQ